MSVYQNARLTPLGRVRLVELIANWMPLSVSMVWIFLWYSFEQVFEEFPGRLSVGFVDKHRNREFAGSINDNKEIELASSVLTSAISMRKSPIGYRLNLCRSCWSPPMSGKREMSYPCRQRRREERV